MISNVLGTCSIWHMAFFATKRPCYESPPSNPWMWISSEFRTTCLALKLPQEGGKNNIRRTKPKAKGLPTRLSVQMNSRFTCPETAQFGTKLNRLSSGFTQLNLITTYKNQKILKHPPLSILQKQHEGKINSGVRNRQFISPILSNLYRIFLTRTWEIHFLVVCRGFHMYQAVFSSGINQSGCPNYIITYRGRKASCDSS